MSQIQPVQSSLSVPVLPVLGPPGLRGPQGNPGPPGAPVLVLDDLVDTDTTAALPGDALTRGIDGVWRGTRRTIPSPHVQSAPTLLVQVLHGLDYCPGGVTSIDTLGRTVEYDTISHPLPGVTELTYGAPFAGTVHLS